LGLLVFFLAAIFFLFDQVAEFDDFPGLSCFVRATNLMNLLLTLESLHVIAFELGFIAFQDCKDHHIAENLN